ncbi:MULTISPECIES: hypothetical protein [Bacillaceae]|uniref:hypothetical protein n=1 Tax=Bacillaceae TaxID=186817 RepID=UPI000E763F0F|nr:hypothetical protein [Bacillus sp. PK3_68]RJS60750.1 hypothetical protein CJ483_12240 [Bacillus sp. PK3_68]
MMKQWLNYIWLGACVPAAFWLYQIQLGAIPFILLSFFLFYRTYVEMKKKSLAEKPSEEDVSKKADKKKAEIVT